MDFVGISLNKFIKQHLKANPDSDKQILKKNLKDALADYRSGVRCNCGNPIWVIGSSFAGNACFTCITGETDTSNDYEIREA